MAASARTNNLTAVNATLLEVINDKEIKRQVDVTSEIVSKIKQTSDYATSGVGRKAIVPTRMYTNMGTVARDEGEALGVPNRHTDVNAEYNYKNLYFAFRLSGQSIASTGTDVQAMTNIVTEAPKEAMYGFGRDVARQVYGNNLGVPGAIAKCGTTTASTTVALEARSGYSAIQRGLLQPGMHVDIGTSGDGDSVVAASLISSVDESSTAPTITIADSVTTSSSHYVSVYLNRSGSDGTSKEITSLNTICDTSSTVGALAPGTYPLWKGTYEGNSGTLRSISVDLLLTALNKARQKGARPDFISTTLGVQQKYYSQVFLPGTRYVGGQGGKDEGDQSAPTFDGKKVNADLVCPRNQLFILSTDHLAFHVPKGENPSWIPGTDGILHYRQGYDEYEAQGYWYANLGTNHRAAQVLVDDINE